MHERTAEQRKTKILLSIAGLGLLIAAAAGLAHSWEWLAAVCSGFGDGCRETADYRFLHAPLWVWGVLFYLVLMSALVFFRAGVHWLVATAFGVELGLVRIMFSLGAVCVYCIANFVVVLLLTILIFERKHLWQMTSVALSAMLLCVFWMPRENAYTVSASVRQAVEAAAVVDGHEITLQELEGPLSSRIYSMELEIYNLKRSALDRMIADLLLKREAERRGMPQPQLLQELAAAAGSAVTEAEIDGYYQQNRARLSNWQGSEQQLREEIRALLEKQKQYQNIMDYANTLRDRADVAVFLSEPPLPHAQVAVGASPTQGPVDAPITIIEFSDYRCPACRRQFGVDKEIKALYGDKIRWVFKAFPLGGNEPGRRAAEAARCAGEQGKFWEYHDALFTHEDEYDQGSLTALAGRLGLQLAPFEQCLAAGRKRTVIDEELAEARKVGIDRTPTLIINGQLHPGGIDIDDFRALLTRALEKSHEYK